MALRQPGAHGWLVVVLVLAWSTDSLAHVRSESFSQWHYREGVLTGRFTVTAREATRLPGASSGRVPPDRVARYLANTVKAADASGPCSVREPFGPVQTRPGYLQFIGRWHCAEPPGHIAIDSFFDLAPEHVHFASMELGSWTVQGVLTREQRTWSPATPVHSAKAQSTFAAFLGHGFRHILSGADHLLFLLLMLIACRRPREVIWAVTGFTLGHSLTLGLAAAGVLEPNLPAVEATIGLTIALVAIERALPGMQRPAWLAIGCAVGLVLMAALSSRLGGPPPGVMTALSLFALCYLLLASDSGMSGAFRLLVTTLFGLVHGLGFASAFTTLTVEPGVWLWPLAGFNLGVELGQLVVVGLLGTLAMLLRTRTRLGSFSADLTGAAGCAMGLYWFVLRGFG